MDTQLPSLPLPEVGAPVDAPRERALVLGGGGSTANAWSIGVIAGLLEAGVDVTSADLIIGTSAGATTAAQITGADPGELLAATLAAAPPPCARGSRQGPPPASSRPVTDHLARLRAIIAASAEVAEMRRRLGASALEMDDASGGAWSARWRATVEARLPSLRWPERAMLVTAVDAVTGEPVLFDRHSGVDLADAVAASCSSGPAYRIGAGRYIDGGYRSSAENADLAVGYARVLVLSPFGGRSLHPPAWRTSLAAQVETLRSGGSKVETVFPEGDMERMLGANAMDISFRAPAASAGRAQARALAVRLEAFWL